MGEQSMTIMLNGSDLTVTQVVAAARQELVPFTQADGTRPADLEPIVELVTRGTLTPAA
jgi:hypothetical protein